MYPINICNSKLRNCNNYSKKLPGSSGNVVITGNTNSQLLSNLSYKGYGKWVQRNAPTNAYGSRTGAPYGYGSSPKNDLN